MAALNSAGQDVVNVLITEAKSNSLYGQKSELVETEASRAKRDRRYGNRG